MGDAGDYETQIRALYHRVLDGWNRASGEDFAASFAEDGEVVGFDGSQNTGRVAIAEEMGRIFADHATGTYVGKVRRVRSLGSQAAVLRAVAGMVPANQILSRNSTLCRRSSPSRATMNGASCFTRTPRRSSTEDQTSLRA
jgi:uncharacterized protein (TIGR02246 family)